MGIANALRRRLNRPVRFDEKLAMDQALLDAHFDLARLRHPSVKAEVEAWENAEDEVTDGVCCDRGIENADLTPGWPALADEYGFRPEDFEQ